MKIRFLVRTALLILLGYVHLGAATDQTFDIQVKFSNVRNTNGRIQLQIYRSQEAFAGEKPWKVIQVPKDSWKDKGFSYKVTGIPAGTYGIAILDDENSNKEMDYSFLVPKEGFGFSNYYHTAWSKPKFENFKFTLNEDISVNIKVRYV